MITTDDLFARFKERLTSVGGEAHPVDNLEQAAEIIVLIQLW
jgi:L-lactate utilization protein LutB